MKLRVKLRALLPVLFLVLLVGVVVLRPEKQVSGVAIKCVGFTNALGQTSAAVFNVTNCSRKEIVFILAQPQIRIGTNWADVTPGINPPTHALEAFQSTNFTLDLPRSGDAWRMPILWAYNRNTPQYRLRCAMNFLSGQGWQYGGALPVNTNVSAEIKLNLGEPAAGGNAE